MSDVGWTPEQLGFTRGPGETDDDLRLRTLVTIRGQADRVPTVENVARWAIESCPRGVVAVTIRDQLGEYAVEVVLHWSWWRRPWRNRAAARELVRLAVHRDLLLRLPVHLEVRVS